MVQADDGTAAASSRKRPRLEAGAAGASEAGQAQAQQHVQQPSSPGGLAIPPGSYMAKVRLSHDSRNVTDTTGNLHSCTAEQVLQAAAGGGAAQQPLPAQPAAAAAVPPRMVPASVGPSPQLGLHPTSPLQLAPGALASAVCSALKMHYVQTFASGGWLDVHKLCELLC